MRRDGISGSGDWSNSHKRLTDCLAILAALTASALFHVVRNDNFYSGLELVGIITLEVAIVCGCAWWVRKILSGDEDHLLRSESAQATLLLLLPVSAFLFRVVQRQWFEGLPWELVLISTTSVLMLGLVVFGQVVRFQRLGVLISLFVMVFSVALVRSALPVVMIVAYCIPAVAWLVLHEWQRFSDRLLDAETVVFRRSWILVLVPVIALVAASMSFANGEILNRVSGWFPSSGGEGDSDPFARDGVGDGNQLVPGEKNIKSVASLEDAPFLVDDRPSLYDSYDDTFEEAMPPKKTEKAIALEPSEAQRGCERIAKSEQGSKEFSTLRGNRGGAHRKLTDLESHAQLHVAGRVPLHLRTEVFDLFDGLNWYPQEFTDNVPVLGIEQVGGKPWLKMMPQIADWLSEPETHVLKIIRFPGPQIPSMLNTTGYHIDKVDRADMFKWHQPGIVALDRDELPPLIAIRLTSKTVDRALTPPPPTNIGAPDDLQVPDVIGMDRIRALTDQWTNGIESGWPEITAIVDQLRDGYELDRTIRFGDAERMPVDRFLFDTHAGPDYLFATAAALMLRHRGYASRVVSGFYASPDHYDRSSKLTSVFVDDVHFWVEVYVGAGNWATIDPTPGYEVLGPPRTISDHVVLALTAAWDWMVDHPVICVVILLMGCLAFYARSAIADLVLTGRCLVFPSRADRQLMQLFCLLERRLRWVGHARPAHVSPRQWWRQLGIHDVELQRLATLIDRRAFSPEAASIDRHEVRNLTTILLRRWTTKSLRQQLSSETAILSQPA